ncbi:MAG: hypothetical protein AAB074_07840 [Planctomycetota bacterium]
MRRALAALFLLALPARAEDLVSLCRQLASESASERSAAIEALRKAGPEADEALETAQVEVGGLARAVREARRWDPEAKVADVEVFGEVASPEIGKRLIALGRLIGFGSAVSGLAVRRILEACAPADRAACVRCLGNGSAARDRGWAREALREFRNPAREVRSAAAMALAAQAGREQIGDIRLALDRETDREIRSQLWSVLIWTSGSPAELPALPLDPEEFSTVLGWMAGGPSSDLRAAAWRALEKRRPATIPPAFWDEPSRLLRLIGTASYVEELPAQYGPRPLPLGLRSELSDSPSRQARWSVAVNDELSPVEVARVSLFLSDPDFGVRQAALGALERWDRANEQKPESERRAALARIGAAARILIDSAAGLGETQEVEWAVRALLEAGLSSSSGAMIAYPAYWIARARTMAALKELEADKELGDAAKRVRRLLEFRIPPQGVSFGRGMESAPRVRSGWLDGVDMEGWRRLVRSEEAEERQLAGAMMSDAWDRLDVRHETAADVRRLAEAQDAAVSQPAIAFLASQAPEQLPEREDIDYREAWSRPRPYVLSRLRAALAPGVVLDRQKASLLVTHGDRALVLAAVRAGRFDQAGTELALIAPGGEAGLLPILLPRLADLEAPLSAPWFSALASCSQEGARVVAAIARDASPKVRTVALASLLSRPWADPFSEPIVEAMAASAVEEERKLLRESLRAAPGRNRQPFTPRMADSIASVLLRTAADGGSPAELESLVATLGESISRASSDSRAALARDPAISSIARTYGLEFSPAVSPEVQILAGDRNSRSRGLSRLPARSLKSIRLATWSWLTCGSLNDSSETWALQRSGELTDLALLSFAADEAEWRDSLLQLRRLARRWYYAPIFTPTTSWRMFEVVAPVEFDGNSMLRRNRAVSSSMSKEPSPGFFALCAAAFRGDTGDEVALNAVIPRLGPDAIPRLVPLLNAAPPGVRQSAAKRIGRLGGFAPRFACAALRISLEGESDRAARSAKLAALVRLNDPAGLEALCALASSTDADDRLAAARALEHAPGTNAAGVLATLAEDADFPVRDAAHAALQRMTLREFAPECTPWAVRDWKRWLAENPGTEFRIEQGN